MPKRDYTLPKPPDLGPPVSEEGFDWLGWRKPRFLDDLKKEEDRIKSVIAGLKSRASELQRDHLNENAASDELRISSELENITRDLILCLNRQIDDLNRVNLGSSHPELDIGRKLSEASTKIRDEIRALTDEIDIIHNRQYDLGLELAEKIDARKIP